MGHIRLIGPTALLTCVLAEFFWPGWSMRFAGVPFALSLCLIGLPHGALDLSLALQLKRRGRIEHLALIFTPYLVGMAASALLFIAAPVAFVSLFIVLSVLHFAETEHAEGTGNAFGRLDLGLLIFALPALFQPAAFAAVLEGVTEVSGQPHGFDANWIWTGGVAGVAVAGLAFWRRREEFRAVDLAEVPVLVIGAAWLDPLFYVGVFFIAWHGVRHLTHFTRRLTVRSLARLHLESLPLSIPSWIAVGAAALWYAAVPGSDLFASLVLVFYGIVTPSHHLLVSFAFKPPQPVFGAHPAAEVTKRARVA